MRKLAAAPLLPLVVLLLGQGGCTGSIEGGRPGAPSEDLVNGAGARGGTASAAGGARGEDVCAPGRPRAGQPRLWRLSDAQYAATVQSWLPRTPIEVNPFAALTSAARYSNDASAALPELAVDQLLASAEALAERWVPELLRAHPCASVTSLNEACATEVVGRVGPRIFRRPLASEELTRYARLAVNEAAATDTRAGLAFALQALQLSPHAIFRTELGRPGAGTTARELTGFEVASLLSYSLTDGPPDDELWTAAEADALGTPAQVTAQVARLLASPAAIDVFDRFGRELFGYPKATAVFKTPSAHPWHDPAGLVEDTRLWLRDLRDAGGDVVGALFTAPAIFASRSTAGSYGVEPPAAGPPVKHAAAERFGMLTQPSWLSAFSHGEENDPIGRGRFVREQLLCEPIPPLPIGAVPPLPEARADATLRERLAAHTQGTCAGCHQLMDPIGLVFERYDHTGRLRDSEAGRPVDTTGSVVGAPGGDVALSGPGALASHLAEAPAVRACLARQLFAFYLGRMPGEPDGCAVAEAARALAVGQADLPGAIARLLTADVVLRREAAP